MLEASNVSERLSEYHAFLAAKRAKKKVQWVYIYGLIDPVTDEVRYIGKSIRPYQRLQNHMNEVSRCYRSHWLQGLKAKGMKPRLLILDRLCPDQDWQDCERHWIATGREMDWPLTNNTDGGDGVCGLPAATRERMRQTWLGRKHRPESLIKIGMASRGRVKSEASKAAMREKMKGRKITWIDKVSAANSKLSDQDQADILEALSSGALVKDLAKQYGVHRTTISKVKMGQYAPKGVSK